MAQLDLWRNLYTYVILLKYPTEVKYALSSTEEQNWKKRKEKGKRFTAAKHKKGFTSKSSQIKLERNICRSIQCPSICIAIIASTSDIS